MARRKDPASPLNRRVRRKMKPDEIRRDQFLTEAFVGTPTGKRWGFTASKLNKYHHAIFRAKFAAKTYFELLVGEDEWEWIDETTVRTDCGLEISGDQLPEIVKYRLTSSERKYFKLDFKYDEARDSLCNSASIPDHDPADRLIKRRRSRKGMILAKDVAEELGIHPKELRRILRPLVEKPDHGWAWRTRDEVEKIKDEVRQAQEREARHRSASG